jgi:hypothetical protein
MPNIKSRSRMKFAPMLDLDIVFDDFPDISIFQAGQIEVLKNKNLNCIHQEKINSDRNVED